VGKLINLNQYRKRTAKAEAAKRADANRRLHGRTKAERERDDRQKRKLDDVLDGARLDPASDDNSDEPVPRR
jgi:ribosomal protein S2